MLKLLRPRPAMPDGAGGPDRAAVRRMEDDLASLVAACRSGEARAMRTLLLAVAPSMLQVIRRVLGGRHPDVDDTLQDAVIALSRALPGFRGECTVRHFGSRIAALTAVTALRRGAGAGRVTAADDVEDRDGGDGLEAGEGSLAAPPAADWAVTARRREVLRRLLHALPEPQAEALVLHFVTGLTVDELARATRVPLETARSRLRLAKEALRERIARDPVASELLEDEP